MLTRTSPSWSDQASQFFYGIFYCIWDTFELGWDAFLEIIAKLGQFFFVIFNIVFQILIFIRDLCIETMQTFANIFQGIINVISNISCDDIEDFASACIVVLLWIGAIKIVLNIITKVKKISPPLLLRKMPKHRNYSLRIFLSSSTPLPVSQFVQFWL